MGQNTDQQRLLHTEIILRFPLAELFNSLTTNRFSNRTLFHGVKWKGVGLSDKNTAMSKLCLRLRTLV